MKKSQTTHVIHAIDDDLTACGLSIRTNPRAGLGMKPTCGPCGELYEYIRSDAFKKLLDKST